jgi:defect-in-organelle-trafficking protein DotC
VADIVYQITNQSRIVSAPRNWQQYLERDWEVVAPPPDILLPESPQEREAWIRWVTEGWEQGIKQADEIFQSDLDLLVADFEGMVRYRRLLAEGKVTAPYATLVDRGVTSSEVQANIGNRSLNITTQLRVGDRAVRITEPASLREGRQGTEWNTATETAP